MLPEGLMAAHPFSRLPPGFGLEAMGGTAPDPSMGLLGLVDFYYKASVRSTPALWFCFACQFCILYIFVPFYVKHIKFLHWEPLLNFWVWSSRVYDQFMT